LPAVFKADNRGGLEILNQFQAPFAGDPSDYIHILLHLLSCPDRMEICGLSTLQFYSITCRQYLRSSQSSRFLLWSLCWFFSDKSTREMLFSLL